MINCLQYARQGSLSAINKTFNGIMLRIYNTNQHSLITITLMILLSSSLLLLLSLH